MLHLVAAAWTPEQWGLIIPIAGLQVVGIITAWRYGGTAARTAETAALASVKVSEQVEAVHQEVRPPSNGTTAGAYTEYLGMALPWMVENLMDIHEALGTVPRRQPPVVPNVEPPPRPPDPPLGPKT